MSNLRDHQPIVIDDFNGLWQRGDPTQTPLDHFQDCNNLRFTGESTFGTRYGIGISQDVTLPLSNIKRIYNYPTQTGNTLIILAYDYDTDEGSIYHFVGSTTLYGPLLTISGMTDFAFVSFFGRAYISPFSSGLPTLPVPDGLAATLQNTGSIEVGIHNYAVTFVTASGETTGSPITVVTTNSGIADPAVTPVINNYSGGGGNLVPGDSYSWKVTYKTSISGPETLPSTASAVKVPSVFGQAYLLNITSGIGDLATYVNVYRTIGNGSTYFLEYENFAAINFPAISIIVGIMDDTTLATQPLAPTSNNTNQQKVQLSEIPLNTNVNATVIARNIYRTAANDTQLKLLTTINDNTTTTFLDNTVDASLGVNIPTKNTVTLPGNPIDIGLAGEFLYVYRGDGTNATKAAGDAISGTMTIANGSAGNMDAGLHIFGIVSETDTGYLSPPEALQAFTTISGQTVSFGNIPTSGDPYVVKRHLVASKAVTGYNGNVNGYQLFFVSTAVINNNTDTFLNNVGFFDGDLLQDASYLQDNYSEIPAGAVLTSYHDRLVLGATAADVSTYLVSSPGEPEAISQIDGLMTIPPDGNPITNGIEYRDVFYGFKRARTVAFTDNGDVPSSWPMIVIDTSLGTSVHGIATVLDTGGSSVDHLIIATYQGISLFNGKFIVPELSWKIESFWKNQDRTQFDKIQMINAPIQKELYCILPDQSLLVGNYSKGMDAKKIRWCPNSYLMKVNTVAIWNIDEIIIGADLNF